MAVKEIQEYLGEDWSKVAALLKESVHSPVGVLDRINAFLSSNGGKMLRPVLSLLVSKACGAVNGDCVRVAASSELLHNATLLHDDVLDDSPSRRGTPTVFSTLGAKPSVLIGDFWLARAMALVLGCEARSKEILNCFSKTVQDLVEGEMLQMEKAVSGDTTEEDYLKIIYLKTASLFQTVCSCAAMAVGAADEGIAAVAEYGRLLGMAFQIKDDILDYEGESLGKPVGTDLREGKMTLPLIGALNKMDGEQEKLTRQKVLDMTERPENRKEIEEMVKTLDGTGYAAGRLAEFVDGAKQAIEVLPDSRAKGYLMELADYCAYRQI